jgi:TatD DNase family protein
MVETDCPYLAPEPLRGRVCEPAFVAHTLAALARLFSIPEAELADATTRNAERFFAAASLFP